MGLLDWFKRRNLLPGAANGAAPGTVDPQNAADRLIDVLVEESHSHRLGGGPAGWICVPTLETVKEIVALDRTEQLVIVATMIARLAALDQRAMAVRKTSDPSANILFDERWKEVWNPRMVIFEALKLVLCRKLPLDATAQRSLIAWCSSSSGIWTHWLPVNAATDAAEGLVAAQELTEDDRQLIERHLRGLREVPDPEKGLRKCIARMERLLGSAPTMPINAGEAWSEVARADLAAMNAQERGAWIELLGLCQSATGAAPTAKWIKSAHAVLAGVAREHFAECVGRWFPLTEKRRPVPALSDRQWRERCADAELSRNYGRLAEASGQRLWDSYREVQLEMHRSEDPWHYLRTFTSQDAVRKQRWMHDPSWPVPAEPPPYDPIEDLLIGDVNMDILRGLAWMCGLVATPEVARALTTLALSAYRKVPGRGPRAVRVGNACITALGMMGGLDAVGQLALLKVRVKFGTAQKQIEKALNVAAEKAGVPREELEEMSVPAYGLTEVGRLAETFGEFTAELTVQGREAVLAWKRADGKPQKSLPAAVKKEFAEELKELTAAKKDIERMLAAQAERLDALFLQQKSWPLATWLERYHEHPLVGTLARRLIWNFTTAGQTTPGLWLNGKLVDRLAQPVPFEAATTVSLWHPLDQAPDMVLGWRGFLEEWQIRQPFKQAHREVYLLTPAEEATRTYSNRFAAHLLRQHQFHSLCAARGWKNKLRLRVDDEYPPASRRVEPWGLRAEFWIEGAGEETNEAGSYLYVATDQVRFYRLDAAQLTAHAGGGGYGPGFRQPIAAEPLPLAEVPRLVFSEIMRDVDLFVGVASVGNDPAWADGGRRDEDRGAWERFSFGELSATAKTRRELLAQLVPKLKIAAQCSFEERFLVVRGKVRTYKIHLGSGNILMAPNDQYLCIVAARGKADDGKVFLPFEGDGTLSVILSKAFLLAADDKITDATILRQIGR